MSATNREKESSKRSISNMGSFARNEGYNDAKNKKYDDTHKQGSTQNSEVPLSLQRKHSKGKAHYSCNSCSHNNLKTKR